MDRQRLLRLFRALADEGVAYVLDLAGRYPVIRYVPPDASLTVDLMARLGERFEFDDLEAESRDVDGVPVSLATPRTLHRLKRDTARPVDVQDAARLRAAFDLEEDG